MRFLMWQIFLSLFILLTSASAGACFLDLSMSLQSTSINLNADNFPNLRIRVTRFPPVFECDFFVVIENGGASSYLNRVISAGSYDYPVQFYKDSGRSQIIKSFTEATSLSDTLSGDFGGFNSSTDVYYRPYIDDQTYRRFGNYSKNFIIRLYRGNLNSNVLTDTKTVTLNFTQSKKIDLSLVNTGAAFNVTDTSHTLDFGTLSQGASMSFDMVLGYNAGYRVSMSSANAGKIKRTSGSGTSTVPYVLTLSGSPVTLSTTSTQVATATGVSPEGGQRLPISVTIGSLAGASVGTYTDTVTFTVSSAE